jgi:hypothetical protein
MHLSTRSLVGLSAAALPVVLVLGAAVMTPSRAEPTLHAEKVCPEALKAQQQRSANPAGA